MIKKVAQVITQSEIGGAQIHVLLLSEELKEKGYTVEVLAADGVGLKEKLISKNINFITLPNMVREISPIKDFKNIIDLIRIFKREKYDVVHCHSSKAGLVARIAARLAGVDRIVYTAHGFVFKEPMSNLKKKIYILFEKIGAKFGHHIITVSKDDYNCALDYKLCRQDRLTYIPNAVRSVNTEVLKPTSLMRKELGIGEEEFVLGTAANFYETKGHIYLIEAAKKLYNEGFKFKILLAGDGPTMPQMKELSKGYENIKFLGFRKDNYDLINSMNLFVLPSVKEGMPYAVLEAMSLKVPVLCTSVGALKDIIEEGQNGFMVDAANSQALYEKLKSLIGNDLVLNKVGNNGYEYVYNNFSLGKCVENVIYIYQA